MSDASLSRDAGLTLVEALVSLLVFSLISAGAVVLLSQSVRAQRGTSEAQLQLRDLQITQTLLASDVAQTRDRRVRSASGSYAPAFIGGVDDVLVRLVRADGESGLVVVEYVVRERALVRRVQRDIDALQAADLEERVLLRDVSGVSMQFFDGERWTPSWLTAAGGPPRAIALDFQSDRHGALRIEALVNAR